MPPRRCLTCRKPTSYGSRCPTCEALANRIRGSSTMRGYNYRWRKQARAAVQAWIVDHGWLCPGYGRAPHVVSEGDLTGDHAVPLAAGGDPLPVVIPVLCRGCNARKRDR